MVVAMVNSPMQTSHSAGCKTQDSAEQDTINDVSLNFRFFDRELWARSLTLVCGLVLGQTLVFCGLICLDMQFFKVYMILYDILTYFQNFFNIFFKIFHDFS